MIFILYEYLILYIIIRYSKYNMSANKNNTNTDNNTNNTIKVNEKKFSIFNENNKLIKKKDIHKILKEGGIKSRISDEYICEFQQAFIHKSYTIINKDIVDSIDYPKGCVELFENDNETLEWLGDSVLQSVMGDYLFNRFPEKGPGFLTKTRSKLVNTKSLSKLANYLNFGQFIIMNTHVEEVSNGRTNSKLLEDAFEAFIGTIYRYFSHKKKRSTAYDVCYTFIITLVEKVIDITETIENDNNFKDKLMRVFQKKYGGKYPIYELEEIKEDSQGKKVYFICVKNPNGKTIGKGFNKKKKQAEQYSAQRALYYLTKNDTKENEEKSNKNN